MSSGAGDGGVELGLRMQPHAFSDRLLTELEVTDWRAVLAVVVAAPGLSERVEQLRRELLDRAGLDEARVVWWTVRRDGRGREQLRAYNRARDTLLASKRLIVLHATSAADVRFMREVAPDLLVSVDVFAELAQPDEPLASWPRCRASLRALMQQRHGVLDFTGLLPSSVEQRVLPLTSLYQPLVELRGPGWALEDERGRGWLVLGHPGTGKTTFVRHLAWTYASGDGDPLDVGERVPLLLSLSDYAYARARDRVQTLIEFLPQWLGEREVADAGTVVEHTSDLLLLLDGLDEMPSQGARRSVLAEIAQLLRAGRVGAVVVTGRSFLVDELRKQDHGLHLLQTRGPQPEEVRAFVRTFVELRGGARERADALIDRFAGDDDLNALARTPLMLAFMVILDELEGRLPDRRIEIYYRLGEMLVDRWTRARSIGVRASRDRPTRADALRVLGPLAWWTLERAGGAVSEAALLQEIERIETRRETPAEAARRAGALLDLLRADTALLVPRPGQRWRFVHQSIAEYFAGVEVERNRERWDALLADPFRPDWREVLLFCAGQLGVIEGRTQQLDRLIAAVLAKSRRGGRYDLRYPSLLIGLLGEAPGLSRRQVEELVDRLLDFVLTSAFSLRPRYQVQKEFLGLVEIARGVVAQVLGQKLRERFCGGAVRWERVFGLPDAVGETAAVTMAEVPARRVAHVVLGPLVTGLVDDWAGGVGLEFGAIVGGWSAEEGWVYRFARWWLRSEVGDRDLGFGEIVSQIPE